MIKLLKDDEGYERALADAGERVVVVCFMSELSLHWMQFQPKVEDFAYKYNDIEFYKIDADDEGLKPLFARGGPGVLPSFYFFKQGEEIDSVKGANEKELRCKLEKYSEQTESRPTCCCCIPLGVAMVIIGCITAWELGYNTYYSVILVDNDASIVGIVFWFLLKLAAMLAFVYLALRNCGDREDPRSRKINFLTYMSTSIVEALLIIIWFTVAWTSHDYKCTFASANCTPNGLCQSCFLLSWVVGYVTIAIPFKIWYTWTTYRYYRVSNTTSKIRKQLA